MLGLTSLIRAFLLTIASAAATAQPLQVLASRQAACGPFASVLVIFMGATPADEQIWCIPFDTRLYAISDTSSISHVNTSGGPCTFAGVDGLSLTVASLGTWDVGPPQRLVSVTCGEFPGEPGILSSAAA